MTQIWIVLYLDFNWILKGRFLAKNGNFGLWNWVQIEIFHNLKMVKINIKRILKTWFLISLLWHFSFVFQFMILTIKIWLVSCILGPFSMLRMLVHPRISSGAFLEPTLVGFSQFCRKQILGDQMTFRYFNRNFS